MKKLLKHLLLKVGNWLLIWVWIILSIWIFWIIYAWTNLDSNDAANWKILTSTLMQWVINNINELKDKFWVQVEGKMCTSVWWKVTCSTNILSSTWDVVSLSSTTSFNPKCEYTIKTSAWTIYRATTVTSSRLIVVINWFDANTTASWLGVSSASKTVLNNHQDNWSNNSIYSNVTVSEILERCF